MTYPPTLAGFIVFIRTVMGISTTVLPDDSPVIPIAYEVALDIVNKDICRVAKHMYVLAVYNLGGDNVMNYAPDVGDPPPYFPGTTTPYFQYLRTKWNTEGFVSGVIQSASDEGTSSSLVVQEAAKTFTLSNLQQLKTPFGRRYLSIAQDAGTLWGLS